jgi:hypothetical protein
MPWERDTNARQMRGRLPVGSHGSSYYQPRIPENYARGLCRHLLCFPDTPVSEKSEVWCCRCAAYTIVTYVYLSRRGRGRTTRVTCGWTEYQLVPEPNAGVSRTIELRCTENASHVDDEKPHYDEAFGFMWPSKPEHHIDLRADVSRAVETG